MIAVTRIIMNKKNIFMTFVLGISAVGTTFSYDACAIRRDLEAKYAHNLINECQLIEDGISLLEVIDRDIRIMEDHKQLMQQNIDLRNGAFIRSIAPFLQKIIAAVAGGVSLATGLGAVAIGSWSQQVWNGETDRSIKITDALVKTGSFFKILNGNDVWSYYGDKTNHLCRTVKGYQESLILTPVLGAVSIAASCFFIATVLSVWGYQARVNAAIAIFQDHINRDNAIIAQLKELKWAVTHR
jgi:hypothetical protein